MSAAKSRRSLESRINSLNGMTDTAVVASLIGQIHKAGIQIEKDVSSKLYEIIEKPQNLRLLKSFHQATAGMIANNTISKDVFDLRQIGRNLAVATLVVGQLRKSGVSVTPALESSLLEHARNLTKTKIGEKHYELCVRQTQNLTIAS